MSASKALFSFIFSNGSLWLVLQKTIMIFWYSSNISIFYQYRTLVMLFQTRFWMHILSHLIFLWKKVWKRYLSSWKKLRPKMVTSRVHFFCPSMLITCQLCIKKYPHRAKKFVLSQLKKNHWKKNQASWIRPWCQYGVQSPNILSRRTTYGVLSELFRNGGDGYEKRIYKEHWLLVKGGKKNFTY